MIIFPAIDIKGGRAVRLLQGKFDKETVYNEDPCFVAKEFRQAGAGYLHIVDLDGADKGRPVNFEIVKKIAEETDMFIQVGGGIRNEERIEKHLSCGVNRVILGTVAAEDPEFVKKMVNKYKDKIAVGVDVREGKVAVKAWKEVTDIEGMEFCERLRDMGVKTVIYTDTSKDGGLDGTNMEAYRELKKIEGLDIIAAGGIRDERELTALRGMVKGAILGKALYSDKLSLKRCLELVGSNVGMDGIEKEDINWKGH